MSVSGGTKRDASGEVKKAIRACILSEDVLSKIFSFANVADVVAIAGTSKQFKKALEAEVEILFMGLVKSRYTEEDFAVLQKRKESTLPPASESHMVTRSKSATSRVDHRAFSEEGEPPAMPLAVKNSWKLLLKEIMTYSYEPRGCRSKELEKNLADAFFHKGVVAFSNLCRHYTDTNSYVDSPYFVSREKGIYFIRFNLNGYYYERRVDAVYAYYEDFGYLNENWESQRKLLEEFCDILGLQKGEYTIEKPRDEHTSVIIHFQQVIDLMRLGQAA